MFIKEFIIDLIGILSFISIITIKIIVKKSKLTTKEKLEESAI